MNNVKHVASMCTFFICKIKLKNKLLGTKILLQLGINWINKFKLFDNKI